MRTDTCSAAHTHKRQSSFAPPRECQQFSLTEVSFGFATKSVRNREAVPAAIKPLAPSVLWLECEVQTGGVPAMARQCFFFPAKE